MRAAIIDSEQEGGGLTLCEVPTPEPAGAQVRVRVAAAGVNRADVLQRQGFYPAPRGVDPRIPGLEYAGIVDAVGPQALQTKVGDRVMGLVAGAAYAEAIVVHEAETIAVPAGMELIDAAGIVEVFLTAYDAIYLQAGLQPGGWCLVRAVTSGVGMAACQLIRALRGHSLGTSRSAEKIAQLAQNGPDVAIVEGRDEVVAAVRRATGGRMAGAVLDLLGGGRLDENLRALSRGGTLVLVGLMGGRRDDIDLGRVLTRRLRIQGTVMRSRSLDEKIALARAFEQRLLPLFASGVLQPFTGLVLPLEQAMAAHQKMEQNLHRGKLVLRVGEAQG